MTQLLQPKKRKSQETAPLFSKPVVFVQKVNFSDTFQDDADWEEFRESLERDEDLKLLIPRCEKLLTALQYAKLLYDFGNACHSEDWEYISNCFINSLKSRDEFEDFYKKFKQMYSEFCDCD